jgi:hypothetical protein
LDTRQEGGREHVPGGATVSPAVAETAGPIRLFKETGNSNSIGCQGGEGVVIHATSPDVVRDCGFMFNPGPAASGARGVGPSVLRAEALTGFVPIYEQCLAGRPPGETHGTAMLSWLAWRRRHLARPTELMLYRAHGAAGKNLAQISKDSQPYRNGLLELRRASDIAEAYGKSVICEDCIVSNGTQDRTQGTTREAFRAGLDQLTRDHNQDWIAVTGQTTPVRTWINQLSANNSPARARGSDIPLAQLDFVRENPLGRMVGPRYVFWFDDVVHLSAARGYVWEGEYLAKAILQELDGAPWKALGQEIVVRRDGRAVEILFDRGGLVFDTTTLPMAPNFGFNIHSERIDVGIAEVSIHSRRRRDDTVRLLLSTEPTGASCYFSYAFDGPGSKARATAGCPGAGAWGNLRDSDATPSRYFVGEALPNWCVVLKERIR